MNKTVSCHINANLPYAKKNMWYNNFGKSSMLFWMNIDACLAGVWHTNRQREIHWSAETCINIHCICPSKALVASVSALQIGCPTTLFYKVDSMQTRPEWWPWNKIVGWITNIHNQLLEENKRLAFNCTNQLWLCFSNYCALIFSAFSVGEP